MQELNFSYAHIVQAQGFGLAFAGMTIVFTALSLVSAFIALLPRILRVVDRYLPEAEHSAAPPADRSRAEDAARIAAIGFALHAHRARGA